MFDALFRLCSDPDANVQNATAFLDRLVKVGSGCSILNRMGVTVVRGTSAPREWDATSCRLPQLVVPVSQRITYAASPTTRLHACTGSIPQLCSPPTLQDIVAESHEFDVRGFIPTLQESLEVSNPFKRQFLLGWLA